jgi:nuclease HARBI1
VRRLKVASLPVNRRHLGLRAIDQVHIKTYKLRCFFILNLMNLQTPYFHANKAPLKALLIYYMMKLKRLMTINSDVLWAPLPRVIKKDIRIDDFHDSQVRQYFRFNSNAQLRRVYVGFRFPEVFKTAYGHRYSGEKVFLVGLYRMRYPNTLNDHTWGSLFRLRYQEVSMCFQLFTDFMIYHWGYLLFDHLEYWRPHFAFFAEKVRLKANSYGCNFSSSTEPGGFNVFGFLDNTTVETCRPGGGPAEPGVNAPRHDSLIQRSFYNGWKSQHGIKFQSISLPNGMDCHIFGAVSLRHNDLYTLSESEIVAKLRQLQAHEEYQYVIYGDSAYNVINDTHLRSKHSHENKTPLEILENTTMSACRESIEWNFGSTKKLWAYLEFAPGLKLRHSAIGNIFLVASILRNAHTCLNGNITCVHFDCLPPIFEHWISGGPRYIPNPCT